VDETRARLKIHRRVIAGWCFDPKSYAWIVYGNISELDNDGGKPGKSSLFFLIAVVTLESG
jgi:hypothetical protein